MHATCKAHKNLALFDFDGTLYDKDSFTGFIFYVHSKRHIALQGFKVLPYIQSYYLGFYPAHHMRSKLFHAMFKQAEVSEIDAYAKRYAELLIKGLNPALYSQLKQHQSLGDDVVLVSASIDIYLKYVCEILSIDLICTQVEQDQQRYTGRYLTADCSCEYKAQRIQEKYELDSYHAVYAYGNSIEDKQMLSLADFSYLVGTDLSLPDLSNTSNQRQIS